jgi:hypothetical protein
MRSRGVLLAAAVVAVLAAVLGVGYVLGRGGGGPAASPEPSPSPPSAAPTGSATGGGSGGPATLPTVSQDDLRWEDFHGLRVPVSASAGPRQTGGDLASGFADSPAGALLAGVHTMLRVNANFGPRVFRPTIEHQVVGEKAAALADVEQEYQADRRAAGVPDGEPTGPLYVTLVGFRWEGYTPGWAVLHLLLQGPAGAGGGTAYVDSRVDLRWVDGDWRVTAPAGGKWDATSTVVASRSGYTRFRR